MTAAACGADRGVTWSTAAPDGGKFLQHSAQVGALTLRVRAWRGSDVAYYTVSGPAGSHRGKAPSIPLAMAAALSHAARVVAAVVVLASVGACGKTAKPTEPACRVVSTNRPVTNQAGDSVSWTTVLTRVCTGGTR